MAQQAVPGGFDVPAYWVTQLTPGLGFASGGFLFGTTTQKVAWVFQVPKTGTLDKFEFMVNFVNSPSDVKFSFQDVDLSTGNPDGVVDQFRVKSGITAVWTVPGLITSDGTDSGSKRSVTRGDLIACVIEWNSATTGEVDPAGLQDFGTSQTVNMPFWTSHNGTSWTKRNPGIYCPVVLKYDDGSYEVAGNLASFPLSAINSRVYNNGSTPDERALYFSFPAPVTVDGGWVSIDYDGNFDFVLYDTDGTTALATLSVDSDVRASTSPGPLHFTFSSAVALTANGNYRLAVKPTSSSNVVLHEYTVDSAAIMGALPGGSGFQLSTRTDAGAWTQTATQRPFMGVHVSKIEAAAAGGTGISRGRVQGGM